ncbi:glycosyltransferase family 2 protein [Cellvibrio sp. KY-GH-1]|nr:glycosyltransferase family 2 protein [Cellvibrio sp. KY-GH-1]
MCRASVIVPVYNAESYIEETLNSILHQDFSDFEIIVVDDGSTDTTGDKVKGIGDPRIKYFKQENSGGPAGPRNVGIRESKGEYIFIFDADDIMVPEKLRLSISAMDSHPEADLLFTNFSTIDEEGNQLKADFLKDYDTLWKLLKGDFNDSVVIAPELICPALVRVNFIGTSSVALRRSALLPVDQFNESLKNSDDRLFWILFSLTHKFIFLNKILHKYRILKNSISNQGFIRRGPSKIHALTIVRDKLVDPELVRLVNKQIANDYVSMAYAYKQKGNRKEQRENALKSMAAKMNIKALKLLISSMY